MQDKTLKSVDEKQDEGQVTSVVYVEHKHWRTELFCVKRMWTISRVGHTLYSKLLHMATKMKRDPLLQAFLT